MGRSGLQSPPDLDPLLLLAIEEHAIALAREAGSFLLEAFQHKLQVEYKSKGQQDPVTDADRKAEQLIMAGIRRRFPDHGILSEETVEPRPAEQDILWVIDPLDGTNNFINRYPFFAVSLGVVYQGIPVVGALFVPYPMTPSGKVFHARLGGGAYAEEVPIHVYEGKEPSPQGLLTAHRSFARQFRLSKELRQKLGDVRTTGSIAYELALVASGVLQYAAFRGPKIWDVAGGVLIAQEAGGEALVRPQRRPWRPLRSFLEQDAGLPPDGDLRQWRAWMLVGSPAVVGTVASNIKPRSEWWRWLRRLAAGRRARARAREQTAGGPDGEIRGAPAETPPAGEAPPPHQP